MLSDTIVAVANQTRAVGGVQLPAVESVSVRLSINGQADQTPLLSAVSLAEDQAARVGLAPPPWGRDPSADHYESVARILLPAGSAIPNDGTAILHLTKGNVTLDLPVHVDGVASGPAAIVPAELPGLLRTALDRPVTMDPVNHVPGTRAAWLSWLSALCAPH